MEASQHLGPNYLYMLWQESGWYGAIISVLFVLEIVWFCRLCLNPAMHAKQGKAFLLASFLPIMTGLIGSLLGWWRIFIWMGTAAMLDFGKVLYGFIAASVPLLFGTVASTILLLANIVLALSRPLTEESNQRDGANAQERVAHR